MSDLLYCYPDSDVLMNKLGIVNQEKLHEVERQLTALRIADLIRNPVKGSFDISHLCRIHLYIFQDLYTWAGCIRKVDISKGSLFCKYMFIDEQAKQIFGAIRKEDYLNGLSQDAFARGLRIIFLKSMPCIHSVKETEEHSGNSSESLRCITASHWTSAKLPSMKCWTQA